MTLDPALLSAIASPRRQEILRLLWNEELTAGAINAAFPDVTFGAVSLQLRALAKAGAHVVAEGDWGTLFDLETPALPVHADEP